jgi:hypothetical protein
VTSFVVGTGQPYSTIQSAINAAHSAGGGTVLVHAGTYTENLILADDVIVSAASESLTYQTHLNGTVSYSGSGGPSLIGFVITPNPSALAQALVVYTGTYKLRLFNCSIDNTGGYPAVTLNTATGDMEVENSVLRSDGGSQPSVLVTNGKFSASTTNVGGDAANPSLQVQAGQGNLYGPATITGPVVVNGGTSTLSTVTISAGTAAAVSAAAGTTVYLAQVGVNTTHVPAISSAGTVYYSVVGYSNTGAGIVAATLVPAPMDPGRLILPVEVPLGAGHALCVTSVGDVGHCTSGVSSSGTCTCTWP